MSTFRLTLALLNNRYAFAALGALAAVGLVLLFRGTPLRAQSGAYLHPADPTINVGERVSIGAYDVPKGQTAYIRMTGPIKPEGRCGARSVVQPKAPQPSTGTGYYDSLWVEGCSQGTGHLRLETQDGSTVFARTTVIVRGPPSTVRGLDVIPGSRKLTLRWAKPTNNGGAALTGYQVQNNQATPGWPGGSSVIENPDTTTFKVEPLLPDTTYQVRVRACNAASLCSDWVYGSGHVPPDTTAPTPTPTPTVTATPDSGAPGPVGNLVVTRLNGTMHVDWDPPTETGDRALTGYHVQKKRRSDSAWPEGSDVIEPDSVGDPPPTERTISGLIGGTRYDVRVQACNGVCGAWVYRSMNTKAPGPVRNLRVTAGDGLLEVDWDEPFDDGGKNLTGYHLQHKPSSMVTWPGGSTVVEPGSETSETIRGLTNGLSYDVRVQACNGECGIWASTAESTTPEQVTGGGPTGTTTVTPIRDCGTIATTGALATPTDLQVIPYSGRRALLTWQGTDAAVSYVVQLREYDSSTASGSWPNSGPNYRPNLTKPCMEIELDAVLLQSHPTIPGDTVPYKGLAEAKAFGFRVQASDGTDDSHYSDTVIMIDTPILRADGNSAGGTGQAKLKWVPLTDVLGSNYAGGTFTFRYRRFAGNHLTVGWRPTSFDQDGTFTTSTRIHTDTIDNLTLREIYAIQFTYAKDGVDPVYAARDVYVRPSDLSLASGSRVATFQLSYPVDRKSFDYSICEETFPIDRRTAWTKLIKHAFEQWELATDRLLTMTPTGEPCADYTSVVNEVVAMVKPLIEAASGTDPDADDGSDLRAKVVALVEEITKQGVWDRNQKDLSLNEIIMFDDVEGNVSYIRQINLFPEFAPELGYFWCWDDDVTLACAIRSDHPKGGSTTDIFLRRSALQNDPLQIPGGNERVDRADVRFNTCLDESHHAYAVLVHEVGHALGIRQAGTGPTSSHPTIGDSVMTAHLNAAFGCSPQPFDVMAMYVLYQMS